jgi:hypothetical protein
MVVLAVLAAVSLPMLYVGSYLALVTEPDWSHGVSFVLIGSNGPVKQPEYRCGGEAAGQFFAPIHTLDRKFRYRKWGTWP